MKVGDLVKLKNQGNGQPGVGIIYEHAIGLRFGTDRQDEYKCLWDDPHWNHSFFFGRELVVISESR